MISLKSNILKEGEEYKCTNSLSPRRNKPLQHRQDTCWHDRIPGGGVRVMTLKLFPAYCLAMKGKSETTVGHLNTFKTNPLERIKY